MWWARGKAIFGKNNLNSPTPPELNHLGCRQQTSPWIIRSRVYRFTLKMPGNQKKKNEKEHNNIRYCGIVGKVPGWHWHPTWAIVHVLGLLHTRPSFLWKVGESSRTQLKCLGSCHPELLAPGFGQDDAGCCSLVGDESTDGRSIYFSFSLSPTPPLSINTNFKNDFF